MLRKSAAYGVMFILGLVAAFALDRFQVFPMASASASSMAARSEARRAFFEHRRVHGDIVFVGDSITQDMEWNEDFPGAINRGIRGDTTADVLKRVDALKRLDAKTYVIMIGVNDVGTGVPTATAVANIRKIVDALPGRKLVMGLTPCIPGKKCDQPGLDEVNRALRVMMGKDFVPTDLDPRHDLVDRVHPNEAGMAKLVEAVRPYLEHHSSPAG